MRYFFYERNTSREKENEFIRKRSVIRVAHDGSICLYFLFFLLIPLYKASAIMRNVTVFRLQTIVENSCRSQGHCPPSEMTINVRKRNEDRRAAVSSNSKYCYELLLRVHEFAVVETPRCSRAKN